MGCWTEGGASRALVAWLQAKRFAFFQKMRVGRGESIVFVERRLHLFILHGHSSGGAESFERCNMVHVLCPNGTTITIDSSYPLQKDPSF